MNDNNYYDNFDFNILIEIIEINCSNSEIIYKDSEKIVVFDKELNQKIAITRNSFGNEKEFLNINKNLKIIRNAGYKHKNYFEIKLSSFNYSDYSFNILVDYKNDLRFNFRNVKVSIRKPSDTYFILFHVIYGLYFTIDDFVTTMSLEGITNDNYSNYFFQVLFLLSLIQENERASSFSSRDEYVINCINKYQFNDNYHEVFHFYYEGLQLLNREISCLYFYKILEYFFIIARKSEFLDILSDYNISNEIDILIKRITKLYKDDELEQLTFLVKSIKQEMHLILQDAVSHKIIISHHDITSFARELYVYRNSFVHGKSDYKFDLKLPDTLQDNQNDLFWKNSLREISKILLLKYCLITNTD